VDGTKGAIARGVTAGLFAGVPQVLFVQVLEKVLGLRDDRADIGPRFVGRLARQFGSSAPASVRWIVAALFHFAYSATWGALYGLVDRWFRPPAVVSAGGLTGLIYLLAFSSVGGGTKTKTEPPPEQRGPRDWIHILSAPISYTVSLALAYEWLRARSVPPSLPKAVGADREAAPAGTRSAW
jgi:ribose/xylose/arabinose/galactoside ABC-type transport system permease subunit